MKFVLTPMRYACVYRSPLGRMLIRGDELGLVEVRFVEAPAEVPEATSEAPPLVLARRWLDIYFSGREPDFYPPLHLTGSAFRRAVVRIMLEIPYGTTLTYGDIANRIVREGGVPRMAAQAVGGAVGHNPVAVIVPCHRVVGAHGDLTGYGGGMARKIALLELEGVDMTGFHLPGKRREKDAQSKAHSAMASSSSPVS